MLSLFLNHVLLYRRLFVFQSGAKKRLKKKMYHYFTNLDWNFYHYIDEYLIHDENFCHSYMFAKC